MITKFKIGDYIFNNDTKETWEVLEVVDKDTYKTIHNQYLIRQVEGDFRITFEQAWVEENFGLVKSKDIADRYNGGKLELTQCPVGIRAEIAAVFQYNSARFGGKYVDQNWRKGMSWSTVLNSIYRHLAEFECGIDADYDDGMDPLAHAGANIALLMEYRKTYPQGDDRYKGDVVAYREVQRRLTEVMEVRLDNEHL